MIETVYGFLVKTPPETPESRRREAHAGIIHIAALTLTKLADGVCNPKLVLAWLLSTIGAPPSIIGMLVPVREAGALLPQIVFARMVEESRIRKHFWVAGSAVQGLAAIGIGWAALTLDGAQAGWSILAFLTILSLARSVCSLSQKDALARTIAKGRRGSVTGAAASLAAGLVLAFGSLLAFGFIPLTTDAIATAILVAGGLWLTSAAVFSFLREQSGPPNDEDAEARRLFAPLGRDRQLRRFIATRALLTATALAPPYLVVLSTAADRGGAEASGLGQLGPFVLASALASILSAAIWGRLSDRSSRRTLASAAILSGAVFTVTGAAGYLTGGLGGPVGSVAAIFFAQIAYEGVRAGRTLHLTDMVGEDARARYTALSNTLIGAVLVVGGALGFLAEAAGPSLVLLIFAILTFLAAPLALSLEEVQAG